MTDKDNQMASMIDRVHREYELSRERKRRRKMIFGWAQTLIRWALSVVLLCVVWQHSHWSVALSLTLIFVGYEMLSALLMEFIQEMRNL